MTVPSRGSWGIVAAVLLLTGCHHNPYGPAYYNYGPYSPAPVYGPSMVPQGGYVAPGPTYVPQNSGPTLLPGNPGSPTPLTPESSNPSNPLNLRPAPNNNDLPDAAPYRPNPSTGNNPVPTPLDADFTSPPPAAAIPRAMPFAAAQPVRASPVSTASSELPDFEEPRRVPVEFDPFDAPAAQSAVSAGKAEPYGYEGKTYSWLRGIVDYDEPTKTWAIIYNLAPDIGDQFGGSFVFAPHKDLNLLKPGSHVVVQGRADPGRKDSQGKALYEVDRFVRIIPPENIQ